MLLTNVDEILWTDAVCDCQKLVRFWWWSGSRNVRA